MCEPGKAAYDHHHHHRLSLEKEQVLEVMNKQLFEIDQLFTLENDERDQLLQEFASPPPCRKVNSPTITNQQEQTRTSTSNHNDKESTTMAKNDSEEIMFDPLHDEQEISGLHLQLLRKFGHRLPVFGSAEIELAPEDSPPLSSSRSCSTIAVLRNMGRKKVAAILFFDSDEGIAEVEKYLSVGHHPNVLRFHGIGVIHKNDIETLVIITELPECYFTNYLSLTSAPSPDHIINISIQVASALQHLHKTGSTTCQYRLDFKPSNIFIFPPATVKISTLSYKRRPIARRREEPPLKPVWIEPPDDIFGFGLLLCNLLVWKDEQRASMQQLLCRNPPGFRTARTLSFSKPETTNVDNLEIRLISLSQRCLVTNLDTRPSNGTALFEAVAAIRDRRKEPVLERHRTSPRSKQDSTQDVLDLLASLAAFVTTAVLRAEFSPKSPISFEETSHNFRVFFHDLARLADREANKTSKNQDDDDYF